MIVVIKNSAEEGKMIYIEYTDLTERIIEHLMNKENMQDDLEGIVLGIYDMEMKKLSERILHSLSDLVVNKKIIEIKRKNGKRVYQLINNKRY